jgi:hypothetical protein
MPPVLARARTDRKRAIVGFAVAYALAAFLALSSVRELSLARTWASIASSLFLLLFVLAVVIGVHVAMRGTFAAGTGAPLDLLADLERRHAGRRRLIRFLRWITGLGVGGVIATGAAEMVSAGGFDPWSAAGTLATCGATLAFVGFTTRRVGKLIERELRAAAEARRLLGDEEAGS